MPTANKSKSNDAKPSNWPANIQYLTKPTYSPRLSKPALQALQLSRPDVDPSLIIPPADTKLPCPRVKIRSILDPAHPANNQHGLFAAQNLAPSSFMLCYLGFVHGPEDADPQSRYDLSLAREHDVGIDSTHMGNEARFINDYRGVSDTGPNAEFRDCWVEVGGLVEKRVGVYVLPAGKSGKRAKGVRKGEEILVSYGKGFWKGAEEEDGGLA